MQTFLPYSSYQASASSLDNKRLGKQRVETLQILQVLLGERLVTSKKVTVQVKKKDEDGIFFVERIRKEPLPRDEWYREPLGSKGWVNHPAVRMWRGHEIALLEYQIAVCEEWRSRGFKDTCEEKSIELVRPHRNRVGYDKPSWLGDEDFHRSHRSNLLRKEVAAYSDKFTDVDDDLPYVWP